MTALALKEAVTNGNTLIAEKSLQPNDLLFLSICTDDDPSCDDGPTIYLSREQVTQLRDYLTTLLTEPTAGRCTHQHPERQPSDEYCRDCGEAL